MFIIQVYIMLHTYEQSEVSTPGSIETAWVKINSKMSLLPSYHNIAVSAACYTFLHNFSIVKLLAWSSGRGHEKKKSHRLTHA